MTSTSTPFQFELDRGERQLWAGSPQTGIVFRGSDVFLIPFSILWAGFAMFWETSAIRGGSNAFFVLWGVPFVAVGLYITIGRFIVDARRREKTAYALTSDRVIIRSGIFGPSTKSLNLRTLSDVTLNEREDGSGTITFGPAAFGQSMYAGMAWPGVQQQPAFELIPDAKHVYEMVRDAQRDRTAPSTR